MRGSWSGQGLPKWLFTVVDEARGYRASSTGWTWLVSHPIFRQMGVTSDDEFYAQEAMATLVVESFENDEFDNIAADAMLQARDTVLVREQEASTDSGYDASIGQEPIMFLSEVGPSLQKVGPSLRPVT